MVTFYVMTERGYLVLKDVISNFGANIVAAVISERDANLEKDYYDEIQALCLDNIIAFYNRKEEFVPTGTRIAISWRWMINNTDDLIVIHDSLLPKYRGFNPLVTALINGDTEIGVTALYANDEFDRGDIIYQSAITIQYPIKIQDAISSIASCYADVAGKILSNLQQGKPLPRTAQDETQASYSLWRDEQDYEIDWQMPAEYIKRSIDALGYPYKGAKTTVDGMHVRITDAEIMPDLNISNRTAGKVIMIKDGKPLVVCGEGILKIERMTDDAGKAITLNKFRVRFK